MDHKQRKFEKTGLPFVTLKLAQTLDGNIATATGDSKWITCEDSRRRGHQLRAESDAILVGRGTVVADDPELSVRLVDGQSPTKIVLDSRLVIPLTAKVFDGAPLIVVTARDVCQADIEKRTDKGAQVWQVAQKDGQLDLATALKKAANADLRSVLIEGGSQIAASALRLGLVDQMAVFVAPKILGQGLPSVGALGIKKIAQAIALEDVRVELLGDDYLFLAQVKS